MIAGYPYPLKKIFQNPSMVWEEPDGIHCASGTSDLWWSEQTMKRKILAKAGWPQYAKKEFPYVIDTRLRFGHIDRLTGMIF